jgi:hypothetical protein
VVPYLRNGTYTFYNLNFPCVKLISGVQFVVSLYRNDTIEHNSSVVGRIYGREKAPQAYICKAFFITFVALLEYLCVYVRIP